MSKKAVERRAVFIVGSPRGGTSVFFKTLAKHPDFAFTTNLSRKFRANFLLVRLAELVGRRHRPVEAGELWKSFWPNGKFERTEEHLTEHHRRILDKIVVGHIRHFRRPVFLNKRPDMVVRIRWLAAGLPSAKFIQLVRDGRATANSILQQCKKRNKPHWSYVGRGMWPDLREMDSASYSGAIWSRTTMLADKALATLDSARVHTVRYEDFVDRPVEILDGVADFCGIDWKPEHHAFIPNLENRNWKWQEQMTAEEQTLMLAQATAGLEYFDYL